MLFKKLAKQPSCIKNSDKASCFDLFMPDLSRSFQDTQAVETGLSGFHKMNITVLKDVPYKTKA